MADDSILDASEVMTAMLWVNVASTLTSTGLFGRDSGGVNYK